METIILAAGESKRMGRDKALLTIDGHSILTHLILKLSSISQSFYIVLGKNKSLVESRVKQELNDISKLVFLENRDWRQGMFSSILKGFESVSGKDIILLQMIDQPFLPLSIYRQLISEVDEDHLIFQPALNESDKILPGHPLIFRAEFRNLIIENKKLDNLRKILQLYDQERKFLITVDKRIKQNLNYYQQYETEVRNNINGNSNK